MATPFPFRLVSSAPPARVSVPCAVHLIHLHPRVSFPPAASSQSLAESIVVDSASGVSNMMREVGFFIMGVYKPRHLSTRTQWLIDPRRHLAFCAVWDSVTVSALVFTSLVTPFEVSFMKPVSFDFWPPFANPTNVVLEIFVLNRVVDSIFFFDMILQFFLMYPVRVENGGS